MKYSIPLLLILFFPFERLYAGSDNEKSVLSSLIDNYHKFTDERERNASNCYDVVVLTLQSDTLIGITIGEPDKYWSIFSKWLPVYKTKCAENDVSIYFGPSVDVLRYKRLINAKMRKIKPNKKVKHKPFHSLQEYKYCWVYYKYKEDGTLELIFGAFDSPSKVERPSSYLIETLHVEEDPIDLEIIEK